MGRLLQTGQGIPGPGQLLWRCGHGLPHFSQIQHVPLHWMQTGCFIETSLGLHNYVLLTAVRIRRQVFVHEKRISMAVRRYCPAEQQKPRAAWINLARRQQYLSEHNRNGSANKWLWGPRIQPFLQQCSHGVSGKVHERNVEISLWPRLTVAHDKCADRLSFAAIDWPRL